MNEVPQLPVRDENGRLHFKGYVTMAPEAAIRRAVSLLEPILEQTKTAATVILAPLPKFTHGAGCCSDPTHVTNIRTEDYKNEILKGVAVVKNIINRHMTDRRIYGVKGLNSAATQSDKLFAGLTGDYDGNLHTDTIYKDVLQEAKELAKYIHEKNDLMTGKARDLTAGGAGRDRADHSADGSFANHPTWIQRYRNDEYIRSRSTEKQTWE